MPENARQLKKKVDRGFSANDADMADGDSSGFEDVDSDEEDNEDTNTQEMVVEKAATQEKPGKKQSKKTKK